MEDRSVRNRTGCGPAGRCLASKNPGPEHEALGRGNIAEERNPAVVSYSIEIPPQLEEWAALGEVRHFNGTNDSGWFTVTDSDRLGPEYLVFLAPSMATIEIYFFGKFGGYIR